MCTKILVNKRRTARKISRGRLEVSVRIGMKIDEGKTKRAGAKKKGGEKTSPAEGNIKRDTVTASSTDIHTG